MFYIRYSLKGLYRNPLYC